MISAFVIARTAAAVADTPAPHTIAPGFTEAPGFQGPARVEYIDGVYWRLTEEFVYCSPLLQTCIRIPAGTLSNFASIPRALWSYMAPTDHRIAKAALVHDELYHQAVYRVTREEADQVLREGMGFLGASTFDRFVVYRFIRAFGSNYTERPLGSWPPLPKPLPPPPQAPPPPPGWVPS